MPTDKPNILLIMAGHMDAPSYPPDFNPQAIVDKVVNAAAQRHGN